MSLLSNQDILDMMQYAYPLSKHTFLNVYARNELPNSVPFYPCSLIINTDTNNLPGKHWIAIYVTKQKSAEYFDSFNQPPPLDVALWMNRFSWKWKRVTVYPIQSPLSLQCGGYVLYYVNERPVDSVKKLLRPFSKDCYANERYITEYVKSKFRYTVNE